MNDGIRFALEVNQNRYLSTVDSELHAIVTVTVTGSGHPVRDAAEVILVDCSDSMGQPPTKLSAAVRATGAAIDAMREGTRFAVIRGTERAAMLYPRAQRLSEATPETKAEARQELRHLVASGGTAIGQWLTLAHTLVRRDSVSIRHALLLTDGRNEHESRAELERALAACSGRMSCDARGIGDDWDPRELLRITSVLRGRAEAVREEDLAEDFRQVVGTTMRKAVPDLRLWIRPRLGTRPRFVKQVHPTESDLTEHVLRRDGDDWEVSTGSWGEESREYHICLAVDPRQGARCQDLQAARIDLLTAPDSDAPAEPLGTHAPVLLHWTDNPALSTRIHPKVEHYTGQQELTRAVLAGYVAYEADRRDEARTRWERALRLADESDNEMVRQRLRGVVELGDGGEVRLKENIAKHDLLATALASVVSRRGPDPEAERPRATGAHQVCPECGRILPGSTVFCERCEHPLGGAR